MKLFSTEAAHWYDRQGTPVHTVPAGKGGMRPTTLRDARKLGLLPSVTNILGVLAKPELTAWLQEQAILAALTLPRLPDEPLDLFARRAVEDSQERRRAAAEFGTSVHLAAQRVATGQPIDPSDPAAPWAERFKTWFQATSRQHLWSERVLVLPLGYAGTADLCIMHRQHGLTLVDIKTQAIRPGNKPRVYSSWCYQLAAYHAALPQHTKCLNLIINSNEPSDPVEHLWPVTEIHEGYEAFAAAFALWTREKQYLPPLCPDAGELADAA